MNGFMSKNIFPLARGEIADWLTRSAIELRFDTINQSVDFAILSIEQEKKGVESAALRYVQELDGDDREKQRIYDQLLHDDNHHHMLDMFLQVQLRSSFIVAYSLFEHTLNQLCNIVRKNQLLNCHLKT